MLQQSRARGEVSNLTVTSRSLQPILPTGDIVALALPERTGVGVGDVLIPNGETILPRRAIGDSARVMSATLLLLRQPHQSPADADRSVGEKPTA